MGLYKQSMGGGWVVVGGLWALISWIGIGITVFYMLVSDSHFFHHYK